MGVASSCCAQRDKNPRGAANNANDPFLVDGIPVDDAAPSKIPPRAAAPPTADKALGSLLEAVPGAGEVSVLEVRGACRFGDGCRRADPWHWVQEAHPGDPDAPSEPRTKPPPRLRPAVDKLIAREGGYLWVRRENTGEDRKQRLDAAGTTLGVCRAHGYELDDAGRVQSVSLQYIDKMVEGTRLLRHGDVMVALKGCRAAAAPRRPRIVIAQEATLLEAALVRSWSGATVAAISAASAYHPGGGFRSGGRHALEEAMCMQSTLAVSLQRALWLSRQPAQLVEPPVRVLEQRRDVNWLCYIPDEGCVVSPYVEVFREGSDAGYGFLQEKGTLQAVVSIAMPNCNPSVKDSPLDAPSDRNEYMQLLCKKFECAIGAAQLVGATTLVMPAVGCGVFRNDPADVGLALKRAMDNGLVGDGIQEIVLAGVPPAMRAALEGNGVA
eukprot:TRINITY_DN26370_c0_g1_i1.p1 TRINITY_DN26370_c0_g1~~TRINITY_DN26370_c0_g1_i1.p1  ORF type:complete len:440 (+),score=99.84 TRINITY_DN26370_c0_g1_i1:70-1389(+)